MPIYEYTCQECGTPFDKFVRSMSAEKEVCCPSCGSANIRRGFSTFASRGASTATSGALSSAAACAPSG